MKADFSDSTLFKKLSSEVDEINKLKWIESEKRNCDIGINQAILIWVKNHRKDWWGKN